MDETMQQRTSDRRLGWAGEKEGEKGKGGVVFLCTQQQTTEREMGNGKRAWAEPGGGFIDKKAIAPPSVWCFFCKVFGIWVFGAWEPGSGVCFSGLGV